MDKFSRIVRDYKNYIWKVSYYILKDEHLAEDACQETLMILNDNLEKIDLDSPRSQGFITVVARHKAYELYNKEKRYVYGEDDISTNLAEELDNSSELMDAIHSLGPLYSSVLLLSSVHGYSDQEIASILKISHDTVRKRKERARKQLEKIYYGEEGGR